MCKNVLSNSDKMNKSCRNSVIFINYKQNPEKEKKNPGQSIIALKRNQWEKWEGREEEKEIRLIDLDWQNQPETLNDINLSWHCDSRVKAR